MSKRSRTMLTDEDRRLGAPLTRWELLELTRVLKHSIRNTKTRRGVHEREKLYLKALSLLSMVEYAPDTIRAEVRSYRIKMANRDKG